MVKARSVDGTGPVPVLPSEGKDRNQWQLFLLPRSCYQRTNVLIRMCWICLLFCSAVFEEPEDPSNRSFFSEIISSISDVKFSHSGRYIMTRDYLTVKVWDLNMENRPIETYQVQTTLYPCVYRTLPLSASKSASAHKGLSQHRKIKMVYPVGTTGFKRRCIWRG